MIVYQLVIKFINKVQIKQQMNHLRVRPLQKPLIVQSTTYNHRPHQSQDSSEASFLKLSQKHSEDLQPLNQSTIFAQIEQRLNRMQAEIMAKIRETQGKIISFDEVEREGSNRGARMMMLRDEAQIAYRYIGRGCEEESEDGGNFEMDENRNYVRDSPNEPSPNLVRQLIEAKEINSEPHRYPLLLTPKQCNRGKSKGTSRMSMWDGSEASSASERTYRKGSTIRRGSCKLSRDVSNSIYTQILSNYSTAKLLAINRTPR